MVKVFKRRKLSILMEPLFSAWNINLNQFRLNSPSIHLTHMLCKNNPYWIKQSSTHGSAEKKYLGWWSLALKKTQYNQRHSSLTTLWVSLESVWAAAWLFIRLWFTSALCDHQNIQLGLTTEAWSGYTEQLHLCIALGQVYFSQVFCSQSLPYLTNFRPVMWK